uniref:Secreted peptide n=1 Tax=Anopheles braziliensis TaxID=58242 RepID=A0A2M3ZLM0_9DIPT
MISSGFVMALLLYFSIFVMAEMAFSVGFTFSGSRLSGAMMTSISNGIAWAQARENCSPPYIPSTPKPYTAACRTSACSSLMYPSMGCRNTF